MKCVDLVNSIFMGVEKVELRHSSSVVPYLKERKLIKMLAEYCKENDIDDLLFFDLKCIILDLSKPSFKEIYDRCEKKGIILGL